MNERAPLIVVTDCDHDSMQPERELAAEHGMTLRLEQCRNEDDVIAAAADADGILVQYAPISARVLAALPQLRVISRYGVGVDTVDVDAAAAVGVTVCNVPDYGTEDVSDHAIALTMSLVRAVPLLDRHIRAGGYDYALARPLHRTAAQVFGVLGLGLIGAATARKARGIGFDVVGYDPLVEPGTVTADGVRVMSQAEVLAAADILSLHMPLTDATRHAIDAASIAAMKPGARIVNTARGGLVHTQALADAISSGRLGGAALDVFESEPLPADSPLLRLPGVVLTPHISWYSEESYGELKRRTAMNAIDLLAGRTPRNVLTSERTPR